MTSESELLIGDVLAGVVGHLDLPTAAEKTLHRLYDDVGEWLSEAFEEGTWRIHSQGSARLGTMVRRSGSQDCDIDSVVVRSVPKESTTQEALKETVGNALERYLKARASAVGPRFSSIEEDDRCFTLRSDDPIHMDVLPAVPQGGDQATALWIPDRAPADGAGAKGTPEPLLQGRRPESRVLDRDHSDGSEGVPR